MTATSHHPYGWQLNLRRASRLTLEEHLFDEPEKFDFFQAVRILERLAGEEVGSQTSPDREPVQFHNEISLTFPESEIVALKRADQERIPHKMTVSFLGLAGQQGVLPWLYTERALRLVRESASPERRAFTDWLALFEHRFISLFYRAWKKYRFAVQEATDVEHIGESQFSIVLRSLCGLGTPALRNRIVVLPKRIESPSTREPLVRLNDIGLWRYVGFLLARPRSAEGLRAILSNYFGVPVRVDQFQGEWLTLEPAQQSRLGNPGVNCQLGRDAVVGDRVWSVESKFRVTLGPLNRGAFEEFLPDPLDRPTRKSIFLLGQLVRLYVGLDYDFDIQLVLKADDVPECQLVNDEEKGPRLGWNAWLSTSPLERDATDAEFSHSLLGV